MSTGGDRLHRAEGRRARVGTAKLRAQHSVAIQAPRSWSSLQITVAFNRRSLTSLRHPDRTRLTFAALSHRKVGETLSIYQLKPRFQAFLRPAVTQLHAVGVTANQVTTFACLISIAIGLWLYFARPAAIAFALIPVWMLLRMALNAVDGMLAREFNQKSRLGAFLNELTDVISDAALYLPFAIVAPFEPFWVAVVITLAGLTEFAGALGPTVDASRRYDGPLGKSDRAFVFGAVAAGLDEVADAAAGGIAYLDPRQSSARRAPRS